MSYDQFKSFFLKNFSIFTLVGVFIFFGILSDKFMTTQNLLNILTQSSSIAILAIAVSFVLLAASIDISVGAIMYLTAASVGVLLPDVPLVLMFLGAIAAGSVFGLVNGFLVARFRLTAFIVTLSTLFIGRSVALALTETRMIMAPSEVLLLGRVEFLGVTSAIWITVAVMLVSYLLLNWTPFGRHLYAIGANPEAARKKRSQS